MVTLDSVNKIKEKNDKQRRERTKRIFFEDDEEKVR